MLNFAYQKTVSEIREKVQAKRINLTAKVKEREERIATLREEYGIDDKALIELFRQARTQANAQRFSYVSNSTQADGGNKMEERTIGAGVVNHLLTESDFVESEKALVKRLERIDRNLAPVIHFAEGNGSMYTQDTFTLTEDELDFLGF